MLLRARSSRPLRIHDLGQRFTVFHYLTLRFWFTRFGENMRMVTIVRLSNQYVTELSNISCSDLDDFLRWNSAR